MPLPGELFVAVRGFFGASHGPIGDGRGHVVGREDHGRAFDNRTRYRPVIRPAFGMQEPLETTDRPDSAPEFGVRREAGFGGDDHAIFRALTGLPVARLQAGALTDENRVPDKGRNINLS